MEKAIKTKQEKDWEAQKLGLAYFQKAVRGAKRDSWHSFVAGLRTRSTFIRVQVRVQPILASPSSEI